MKENVQRWERITIKKWKTLKSKYLYQTPFGNLREDQCELPNGMIINDYHVNEYADWVNALVLTQANQVVLVNQYRQAGGDFYLEIPAGKMEENESYEEGILREVREETGYISKTRPIKLGEYLVNPAAQTNKVITFLIVDAYKAFDQDLDDTEEIEVQLYDWNEMEKALKEEPFQTQLFTAFAFYRAKDFLAQNQSLR